MSDERSDLRGVQGEWGVVGSALARAPSRGQLTMEVIDQARAMQSLARGWTREGVASALVPTMGALHRGHLRLIEEGRRLGEKLVVSVFVNPAQFGPGEDLERYPRSLEADCRAAEAAGADVVFAPSAEEIYPARFQTHVRVEELGARLCGPHRPGHFQAVATVVAKLFILTAPSVAVFGWKDAQQFVLLRRMVRDLALAVEMVAVETVREEDGLALSSRNELLSPEERAAAPALYRALGRLTDAAESGQRAAGTLLAAARNAIESEPLIRLQYLEMVSLDGLEPLAELEPRNTLVALAAHLGSTRLIDNVRL